MSKAMPLAPVELAKFADYHLFAFDLDNTLCESKQPMPAFMAELLLKLLVYKPVAVISGGAFKQFQIQVLQPLEQIMIRKIDKGKLATKTNALEECLAKVWQNLHLLPACGTSYWQWRVSKELKIEEGTGSWQEIYRREFSQSNKQKIQLAVKEATQELAEELEITQIWGLQLEDRGQQFTWSALGQAAPLPQKTSWDPEGRKRRAVQAAVAKRLGAEFSVQVGGSTSVDIMAAGIDKGYALQELIVNFPEVDIKQVIFWGDQIAPDGNDYPVFLLGVPCVKVDSWQDCAKQLEKLLEELPDIFES